MYLGLTDFAATPLATADKASYLESSNNETAGKEPVSGVLGKGTATEPFDQGNEGKFWRRHTALSIRCIVVLTA